MPLLRGLRYSVLKLGCICGHHLLPCGWWSSLVTQRPRNLNRMETRLLYGCGKSEGKANVCGVYSVQYIKSSVGESMSGRIICASTWSRSK